MITLKNIYKSSSVITPEYHILLTTKNLGQKWNDPKCQIGINSLVKEWLFIKSTLSLVDTILQNRSLEEHQEVHLENQRRKKTKRGKNLQKIDIKTRRRRRSREIKKKEIRRESAKRKRQRQRNLKRNKKKKKERRKELKKKRRRRRLRKKRRRRKKRRSKKRRSKQDLRGKN